MRYVASSPYVMNILTYLFTTVFIGASFVVFSKYHVSFNLTLGLVHDRFPRSVAQYVQFPERLLPVDQGQA